MIYKGSTFICLAIIVKISTHNHIAISISIYIAGGSHGGSEISTGPVAFNNSCRSSIDARRRAMIYKGSAFLYLAILITIHPNDHIAVSIAIYITCSSCGPTQESIELPAHDYSVGRGTNTCC